MVGRRGGLGEHEEMKCRRNTARGRRDRMGIERNERCDTMKVVDGSLSGSFDRDCAFKPQIYDSAKARE